jgi:hypothetical protein
MGTYRVPDHVNHLILGHYPGEQFTADIPADQEARLVARGQLEVVKSLSSRPREELDEMARALNIDPAAHSNKPSLIEAIEANTPSTEE